MRTKRETASQPFRCVEKKRCIRPADELATMSRITYGLSYAMVIVFASIFLALASVEGMGILLYCQV